MNAKKERIIKMSKILRIYSNIGGAGCILGILMFIGFIIAAPLESLATELSVPNGVVYTFLAILALISGYLAVIYFVVSSIFLDISRDHTPFSVRRVKNIKRIAKLVIVFNIALTAILYCLAWIFEYGVDLQQQADETL